MQIQIGRATNGTFTPGDLQAMHRLRHDVFRTRLGWEVEVVDGEERDQFDALDPVYLMVKDADALMGCWRLLPTTGPTMITDTFAQTVQDGDVPRGGHTWELSRFALGRHEGVASRFSGAALAMMEAAVDWGLQQGVARFVTVTTVAIERLMRTLGIRVRRMGQPVQVGIERAVALEIPLDGQVLMALRAKLAAAA